MYPHLECLPLLHQIVEALVELVSLGVALAHQLLAVLHHGADPGLVVGNLASQHLVLLQQQVHGLQKHHFIFNRQIATILMG